MPESLVSESRTMAVPAATAYELIADCHTGHPSILPPEYFGRLEVLAGGRGCADCWSGSWRRGTCGRCTWRSWRSWSGWP